MMRIWASVLLCTTLFASSINAAAAPTYHELDVDGQPKTGIVTRSRRSSYWLGEIDHNGASPYNSDKNFVVYRNVMEYVHTPVN